MSITIVVTAILIGCLADDRPFHVRFIWLSTSSHCLMDVDCYTAERYATNDGYVGLLQYLRPRNKQTGPTTYDIKVPDAGRPAIHLD